MICCKCGSFKDIGIFIYYYYLCYSMFKWEGANKFRGQFFFGNFYYSNYVEHFRTKNDSLIFFSPHPFDFLSPLNFC